VDTDQSGGTGAVFRAFLDHNGKNPPDGILPQPFAVVEPLLKSTAYKAVDERDKRLP
jgi:hypothetical protein